MIWRVVLCAIGNRGRFRKDAASAAHGGREVFQNLSLNFAVNLDSFPVVDAAWPVLEQYLSVKALGSLPPQYNDIASFCLV